MATASASRRSVSEQCTLESSPMFRMRQRKAIRFQDRVMVGETSVRQLAVLARDGWLLVNPRGESPVGLSDQSSKFGRQPGRVDDIRNVHTDVVLCRTDRSAIPHCAKYHGFLYSKHDFRANQQN